MSKWMERGQFVTFFGAIGAYFLVLISLGDRYLGMPISAPMNLRSGLYLVFAIATSLPLGLMVATAYQKVIWWLCRTPKARRAFRQWRRQEAMLAASMIGVEVEDLMESEEAEK